MKSFWLSMIALVMFTGVTYADSCSVDCPVDGCQVVTLEDSPELAPLVTIESLTEIVAATTAQTLNYVDGIMVPIAYGKGETVQGVMTSFQDAIAALSTLDVDVTALQALFDDAGVNFNIAIEANEKCCVYIQVGDVLSAEADTVKGVDALILRLKASLSYCAAASYAEQCDTALNTVLEISRKGQLLYEKLIFDSPKEDEFAARYHLRTRARDFFRRSRSRKV